MPCTVFANGRGVVHKGSGGMSTVFPDVCKTPAPPAPPIPIPYPNIGKAADTSRRPDHGDHRRQHAHGQGREVHDEQRRRGGQRRRRRQRRHQGRVRVHDVLVRREVRGQERLPPRATRCSTTRRTSWADAPPRASPERRANPSCRSVSSSTRPSWPWSRRSCRRHRPRSSTCTSTPTATARSTISGWGWRTGSGGAASAARSSSATTTTTTPPAPRTTRTPRSTAATTRTSWRRS